MFAHVPCLVAGSWAQGSSWADPGSSFDQECGGKGWIGEEEEVVVDFEPRIEASCRGSIFGMRKH